MIGAFMDTTDLDPGPGTHILSPIQQPKNDFYLKLGEYEVTSAGFVNKAVEIDVYPNPGAGVVFVSVEDASAKGNITVSDIAGNHVYTEALNGLRIYNIPLTGAANGLYFVEVKTDKGITTRKVEVVR